MFKKLLVTTAIATASFGATMADLESRVEALEFAGYENWWKFSGNLEYRFDNVEREYKKGYTSSTFSGTSTTRNAGDKVETKHHRIYSELDIEAKPSEKLSFYGRLATAKYMNTLNKGGGNYTADGSFNELSEGQGQGNSAVFLERAFVNYNFTKELTFSIGRLPTIDGAPKHFAEGRPMMGQYPLLAFGGIFDGVALTYAKQMGTSLFKLRGIYTPFNQRNLDNLTDKLTSGTNKLDESVDVYSAMFEFEKVNMSWAKRIHFIYQYLYFNGLSAVANSTSTVFIDAVNATRKLTVTSDAELGAERHVLYLEANGIANTGFSAAFSYLIGKTMNSGNINQCIGTTASGCEVLNKNIGTWYGDSANNSKGNAWIANVNYQFSMLNSATIGFEYMDSDKNAFLYDSSSKNLVGQYTSRGGNSMHVYWIQPVDNKFKIRLGYQTAENKYTNSFGGYLGETLEIDNKSTAYYTSLQFSF
ncbi:DUF3373 family protein [Bacteriovorax sp. Seq25_V]|uniref:DUF3373 family protein n=1 Tax=Bacteriovorax sp. Seq25_V TaxID=1201288 RepID=UPI000389E932|nr:DUF3373 family protein [Bacteriovorax sp. Seq25_V]EQC46507.1 PF11853 family protein [Bacteriovorax sp. Seq25_V]